MIKTKGHGAGGKNTNFTGLNYETLTDLNDKYKILFEHKLYKVILFNNSKKSYIITKKCQFLKYMNNDINKNINSAHGCKYPDECFIDKIKKNIFIIEKKFQQVSGSVCEKIQTPDFKIWQFTRMFPDFKIIYIYCLSNWFINNCKAELEYLRYKNIPIFIGNDINYKSNIINFITNYQS